MDPRWLSDDYEVWVAIVEMARSIAIGIAEVERRDALAVGGPQLDVNRQMVDKMLVAFRGAVEGLQQQ